MRKSVVVGGLLLASCAWSLPAKAQNAGSLQNGLSTTVRTVKTCLGGLHPCQTAWLQCVNPNASVAYVQLFDTTAAPTLGTTVPKLSIGFAANQAPIIPMSVNFLNAIKIAATTTATGSTALGTALDCNVGFQ